MFAALRVLLCRVCAAALSVCLCRYWPLGDLFHIVVGIVLMSVVLVGYAATTKWSMRVCQRADLLCEDLLICAPRRAMLLAHLQSALRGANVMGVTVSEDFCVMVRQPVSILHLLGVGHRLALRLSVFADPEVDGRTPLCTVLLGCGDHNLVSRSQLDAGRVSGRHAVRQPSMQPSDTLPYARAAVACCV